MLYFHICNYSIDTLLKHIFKSTLSHRGPPTTLQEQDSVSTSHYNLYTGKDGNNRKMMQRRRKNNNNIIFIYCTKGRQSSQTQRESWKQNGNIKIHQIFINIYTMNSFVRSPIMIYQEVWEDTTGSLTSRFFCSSYITNMETRLHTCCCKPHDLIVM